MRKIDLKNTSLLYRGNTKEIRWIRISWLLRRNIAWVTINGKHWFINFLILIGNILQTISLKSKLINEKNTSKHKVLIFVACQLKI